MRGFRLSRARKPIESFSARNNVLTAAARVHHPLRPGKIEWLPPCFRFLETHYRIVHPQPAECFANIKLCQSQEIGRRLHYRRYLRLSSTSFAFRPGLRLIKLSPLYYFVGRASLPDGRGYRSAFLLWLQAEFSVACTNTIIELSSMLEHD